MNILLITGVVVLPVAFLAAVVFYLVKRERERELERDPPLRMIASVGGHPDDDDPAHDPDVRAMMLEVMRTGRPMHMNRGEAPRFCDDEPAPPSSAGEGEKR